MARNPKPSKKTQERRPKPGAGGSGRPRRGRPKFCIFCSEHATWVDYKDVAVLKRFINDRGRVRARGATGTCAQHQRDVATAIKTARELALLPYSVRTAGNESRGGRGGDRRLGATRSPAEGESGSASAEPASEAIDGTEEPEDTGSEAESDGSDIAST